MGLVRLLPFALIACIAKPAAAQSFLDTDPFCQSVGCVIVHDGVNFEIYDVHNFETGGSVPVGEALIRRVDNPLPGPGVLGPVITGTLVPAVQFGGVSQGVALGFDLNGDGTVDQNSLTNSDGFLDAEDIFAAVNLNQTTQLRTIDSDSAVQRSFFIASRNTRFSITAQLTFTNPDAINGVNNIDFSAGVQRRGTDGGLRFGRAARRGGARIDRSLNTLGALAGGPQVLVEFRNRNGTRIRNAESVADHSVRFDYAYGLGDYDLALETGFLDYQIEFNFIRD